LDPKLKEAHRRHGPSALAMIEKIIESCAKNRFLVFAAVLLLTLGGV